MLVSGEEASNEHKGIEPEDTNRSRRGRASGSPLRTARRGLGADRIAAAHTGTENDHRTTRTGMFRILNSGAQWRDMPARYGKWKRVCDRYRRWTREKGCSIESCGVCMANSIRKAPSAGACSTSMGRTSGRSDRPKARLDKRKDRRRNVVERCIGCHAAVASPSDTRSWRCPSWPWSGSP